jgi:Protein of unknown function VcgC/VcgE (DUF2780)
MKILTTIVAIAMIETLAGCATAPQNVAQTSNAALPSAATTVAKQLPPLGTAGIAGSAASATQPAGLVNILVQRLGVTPQQATGGAGSIFSMAKQSMSSANFSQVSKAVPGMAQYLAAAPSLGAPTSGGGLMGAAASALGGGGGALGNMAALAGSFQNLGLDSGMMGKFIPVILQYVQNQGGSSAMSLLQGAIMP